MQLVGANALLIIDCEDDMSQASQGEAQVFNQAGLM